jgi:hypothetical protein
MRQGSRDAVGIGTKAVGTNGRVLRAVCQELLKISATSSRKDVLQNRPQRPKHPASRSCSAETSPW